MTSFVGRSREIATVLGAVLGGDRLVSLVGPPGIGKTRLSREVAEALRTRAARPKVRTVFCDLTEARTIDDVCAATANALGAPLLVAGTSAEAAEALGRELARAGRLLLILDNFEQLVHCARETVASWLSAAPRLCCLVTTRCRLRLERERCVDVTPLEVPGGDDSTAALVAGTEGGELFVVRARAVRGDFELTDDTAPAVAGIVRRMDGIPLAIELCAARMRALSPGQLFAQLGDGFDVLARGPRDAAARHATLRGALAWSWDLLEPWEQSVLAQCSVFRGGFGLDAAARVLSLPADAPATASDVGRAGLALEALRDKSLVDVRPLPGATDELRYCLLETVRDFANEKLAAIGIREQAIDRHAAYYLDAAGAWSRRAYGANADRDRLVVEIDNLLAVCERALASGDGPRALDSLLVLEPVLAGCPRARPDAYVTLLDAALDVTEGVADDGARARALIAHATADLARGRIDSAFISAHRALAEARASNARKPEGVALALLGFFLVQADVADEAARCFEEARAIGDVLRDPELDGIHALATGGAMTWSGDARGAATHQAIAAERFGEIDDDVHQAMSLGQLGLALLNLGRPREALSQCTRALELSRALGDRRTEAYASTVLGRVLTVTGDHASARALLEEGRAIHRAAGDRWAEAFHESLLGNLEVERGDLDRACDRYLAAATLVGELVRRPERHRVASSRNLDRRYAAVHLARLAATLASLGRLDDAIARWREVDGAVIDEPSATGSAVRVHGAHVALAEARRACDPSIDVGSMAHRLAEALAADECHGGDSEDVRFALRLLTRDLGRRPPLLDGADGRGDARPAAVELLVGPEACWFERAGGGRVRLSRRKAPRLVLLRLVEHRLDQPGGALGLQDLFEAGWPGERIASTSVTNRVYVTLARLKELGLRGVLQRRDDGFLLDPEALVRFARDRDGENVSAL